MSDHEEMEKHAVVKDDPKEKVASEKARQDAERLAKHEYCGDEFCPQCGPIVRGSRAQFNRKKQGA